jgi:Ca-activated chloride channel family protein
MGHSLFATLVGLAALVGSGAQVPTPPVMAPAQAQAPIPDGTEGVVKQKYASPHKAYDAGAYTQALQGFIDDQVEHPDDADLMINIGSAHYQMQNYAEAEKSFAQAALSGTPEVRQQAMYSLGNTLYRAGKLEDAIKAYQSALELNPNDEDAKFNIEFVRDEIRKRHEEAQKTQQQQQEQKQQQEEQNAQKQDGQQQPQEGQNAQKQDEKQAGEQGEKQQQDEAQQRQAAADKAAKEQQAGEEAGQPAGKPQPMTQEEAERYLQALQEGRGRNQQQHKGEKGQRYRAEKDW